MSNKRGTALVGLVPLYFFAFCGTLWKTNGLTKEIYVSKGDERMKYTSLGRTGMQVSRLCLGTMNFGNATDEKEAFRIMDAALDAGINYFDTSNNYGGGDRCNFGLSEEIIGRWFAQGGNRRERTIIATKVYFRMDDPNDGPNDRLGLSAYKIRRHIEGSLRRLQTDYVELYQMHHVDRNVTWAELWGVFSDLVSAGKVVYVGSSNFAGRDLVQAQYEAEKYPFMGLVTEQHRYNLMGRLPELEVLPAAHDFGIGVVPYSPLNGGLLSENALNKSVGQRTQMAKERRMNETVRKQLEDYHALCQELGEKESNVALAWLLKNPAITAPITGPRTVEQLENSLRAVEIDLSDDVMKRLDEIFPGPGGAAPNAYAW